MAIADNAGTEIRYEVTGEGTPVVLLHGFPDSGKLWRHQVPALTVAGYRVIVPDMRGYGRSARPVEVRVEALHAGRANAMGEGRVRTLRHVALDVDPLAGVVRYFFA